MSSHSGLIAATLIWMVATSTHAQPTCFPEHVIPENAFPTVRIERAYVVDAN